jgi:predicted PurR-regulated permease PerM
MPFLIPVIWGAIIAVALFPLFSKVAGWLGGRQTLAASLIALVLIALIILPAVSLSESILGGVAGLVDALRDGNLEVPPPPPNVADWPVVGEKAFDLWSQAADNVAAFVNAFREQVVSFIRSVVGLIASGGTAILFTVISLIIAAAFLAKADVCVKGVRAFAERLGGDKGVKFVTSSGYVIKSVATGVIGVAVIQAILGFVGFLAVGLPLAAVWALILLILAIAQVPALLLMVPIIIYVFATNDGISATIFAIWAIFVAVSDGFLKPMLLGRGLDVPTLVILMGAIGGMILMGIIGLFIGAVVLAIGWELLEAWVIGEVDDPRTDTAGGEENLSSAS